MVVSEIRLFIDIKNYLENYTKLQRKQPKSFLYIFTILWRKTHKHILWEAFWFIFYNLRCYELLLWTGILNNGQTWFKGVIHQNLFLHFNNVKVKDLKVISHEHLLFWLKLKYSNTHIFIIFFLNKMKIKCIKNHVCPEWSKVHNRRKLTKFIKSALIVLCKKTLYYISWVYLCLPPRSR